MSELCQVCGIRTNLKCEKCHVAYCSELCQISEHYEFICAPGKHPRKPKQLTIAPTFVKYILCPATQYDLKTIMDLVVFYPSKHMPPIYDYEDRNNKKYDEMLGYIREIKKTTQEIGITHLIHGEEPISYPRLPYNNILNIIKYRTTSVDRKGKYAKYIIEGVEPLYDPPIIYSTTRAEKLAPCAGWCSDLSLEKVDKTRTRRMSDPDYILIWQSILESGTTKDKIYVNDDLWIHQLELTFRYYDLVIRSKKLILLGCAQCINRSPHTMILYLMYHGIDVQVAHDAVLQNIRDTRQPLFNRFKAVQMDPGDDLFGWETNKLGVVRELKKVAQSFKLQK